MAYTGQKDGDKLGGILSIFGFGGKTIKTEGSKIANFQLNTSTYGLTVPVVFGTTRIPGNVIDWYDFTQIAHTTRQSAGKGGGGTTAEHTEYTYTVACLIGLCEGTMSATGKVWRDKEVLNNVSEAGFTLFRGTIPQNPWGNTQSRYPEKALPYAGLAYLAGIVDLGNSGSLSTYNFEVKGFLTESGDGIDANPADVIKHILLDRINGVGFGAGQIDEESWNNYKKFCYCADLLVSTPPGTMDKQAYEIINDICQATNTIVFWSQNKLKFIPLCDERLARNGVIYEPNKTIIYDLNADHFIPLEDGSLVQFEREDNSESFNQATVEFINRKNGYEIETTEFQVLSDISRRGLRPAPTKAMHFFHTKERAQYAAELEAMQSLYARNKYRFKLDWSFCALEPGDLVTITDEKLGLDKYVVMIEPVTEAEDGELEFLASPKPPGIYSAPKYSGLESSRPSNDYNIDPGDIKDPIFFETPFTDGSHYVGIMACGQIPSAWGGASIWISLDNEAYQQIGNITAPGVYGRLVYPVSETDTSMTVILEDPKTQLLGVSEAAADANASLCAIGSEWVAYETAELIAEKTYQLSGLRRGLHNSAIVAHAANEGFLKYDIRGFLYPYRAENIGQKLYIKLSSYNIFGLNPIPLEDLEPYTYTIKGAGDLSRTERGTREILTPGWTAFDFEQPFQNPPAILWVDSLTPGAIAYYQNVTATGFEAILRDIQSNNDSIGNFKYEAQGW